MNECFKICFRDTRTSTNPNQLISRRFNFIKILWKGKKQTEKDFCLWNLVYKGWNSPEITLVNQSDSNIMLDSTGADSNATEPEENKANVQRGKWNAASSIWYQQSLRRSDVTQTPFSFAGAIKRGGMSREPGFTPKPAAPPISCGNGCFLSPPPLLSAPLWQNGLCATNPTKVRPDFLSREQRGVMMTMMMMGRIINYSSSKMP